MDVKLFEPIVQPELTPVALPNSEPGVTLRIWERRTLNYHQAVIYLDQHTPFRSSAEVQQRIQ